MIFNLPTKQYLSDSRVTNISKSFTYKMAAKTNWYRYGTKLRHCHPKISGARFTKKILRQSYDYLTIMPNLLSAYDGRRVYKTSYGRRKAVLGTVRLKDRKIAYDSVCELAYEFLREILARRSSLA